MRGFPQPKPKGDSSRLARTQKDSRSRTITFWIFFTRFSEKLRIFTRKLGFKPSFCLKARQNARFSQFQPLRRASFSSVPGPKKGIAARAAVSCGPVIAPSEYIQYFIVDRAGLETVTANDRLKFLVGAQKLTDIFPITSDKTPVFAAVLKPNTDQVDGFCEFVITEMQPGSTGGPGDDMIGYFVNTRLKESISGNVSAVFCGLFAEGDKKIVIK